MIVKVNVKPGSSQAKITETEVDGEKTLTIWTHARAHDNEANKAVVEALAEYFNVSKTSISLVRGGSSKQKTFEIK